MKPIAFAVTLLMAGSAQAQNIFGNPWDRQQPLASVNRGYVPPPVYQPPQPVYRPPVNCTTYRLGDSLHTTCN